MICDLTTADLTSPKGKAMCINARTGELGDVVTTNYADAKSMEGRMALANSAHAQETNQVGGGAPTPAGHTHHPTAPLHALTRRPVCLRKRVARRRGCGKNQAP